MSNKEHGNYVQLLKCSSAVVCKSLNFRSNQTFLFNMFTVLLKTG